MTTAYILIAAIVILGGAIATVGDRIGTKVGKARLSLFNLRPRKTAVLVTILTGSIISIFTLAILFAVDEQLRTGVFKLEEIQHELRTKRQQLAATNEQKNQVEEELAKARAEQKAQQIEAEKRQAEAEKRLQQTNQSLQAAIAKQNQIRTQLQRTQKQLSQVKSQFQQAQTRLQSISQQVKKLRAEIQKRQAELQGLIQQRNQLKAQIAQRDKEIAKLDQTIEQRDQEIAERNQEIVERNQVLAQRESRLKELETKQEKLEQEAQLLEQDLQELRRGNVAVLRGQVLASRVVRIVKPSGARQAIDQILREANQTAIGLTQPGVEQMNERVVNISEAEVKQIINQIDDGRDYVVRIIAAGNYVLGEKPIRVFADVAVNQKVFSAGEVLASISANPATMSAEEIRRRVELLLGASQFRANSAGILGNTFQVSDNRIPTLYDFFEKLKQYNQPVELKAVAAEDIYTVGPLKIELLAVQNGQVVFSTRQINQNPKGNTQPQPTTPPPDRSNPQKQTEGEAQTPTEEVRIGE